MCEYTGPGHAQQLTRACAVGESGEMLRRSKRLEKKVKPVTSLCDSEEGGSDRECGSSSEEGTQSPSLESKPWAQSMRTNNFIKVLVFSHSPLPLRVRMRQRGCTAQFIECAASCKI